jgi:N-acetylneuraminic acid mutarotase
MLLAAVCKHRVDALEPIMSDFARPGAHSVTVLVVLALCVMSPPAGAAEPSGTWSIKSHLPEPRGETAMAVANGKLYVLGGYAPGLEASPLAEEYDPTNDSWRVLAPIPRATSHPGVTAMDGKLYVIGGFSANVHAGALDTAFAYDPATNTWRSLPQLGTPRGSIGVVALDGKIHAIGGRGLDKITVATHDVYHPGSGKWNAAAPLPVARDHLAVAAADGKLHVIGGRKNNNTTDNVDLHDVYDPASDNWSKAAPMPTARSAAAAALANGMILVVGGECDHGHTFNQNEAYDLAADRWLTLASPVGRHGFGGAALGADAYFAGGNKGCGGGDVTDELLMFKLR